MPFHPESTITMINYSKILPETSLELSTTDTSLVFPIVFPAPQVNVWLGSHTRYTHII